VSGWGPQEKPHFASLSIPLARRCEAMKKELRKLTAEALGI